jgi:transposase
VRDEYENQGMSPDELASKYGREKETVKNWIRDKGWTLPTKEQLDKVVKHTEDLLTEIGFSGEELKKAIRESDSNDAEFEYIETLKYTLLSVGLGKYKKVKKTYSIKDGKLVERFREIQSIPPDTRASQMFFEIDEKLASWQDIGDYETDAELEERYKGYREKKLKEREEFINRKID